MHAFFEARQYPHLKSIITSLINYLQLIRPLRMPARVTFGRKSMTRKCPLHSRISRETRHTNKPESSNPKIRHQTEVVPEVPTFTSLWLFLVVYLPNWFKTSREPMGMCISWDKASIRFLIGRSTKLKIHNLSSWQIYWNIKVYRMVKHSLHL